MWQALLATSDLRLLVVGLHDGVLRELDRASHDGGIADLGWSADGRWACYVASTSAGARTSAVRICEVESGRVLEV